MKNNIIDVLEEEYNKDFRGWDFSYLIDSGRMEESLLPWSYRRIVENYFSESGVLLDMGTGGGEFLSSLRNLPEKIYATEGYEPNFYIAKEKLKSLNGEVRFIHDKNSLPFEDSHFDIIINRHEDFSLVEIERLLKPGGVFITQQVGGLNDYNLNLALNSSPSEFAEWNLFSVVNEVSKVNLTLKKQNEAFGYTRFFDVGAIAYYLKCIPWQISDFSIEKYETGLLNIHHFIQENGFIDLINHRFIVVAHKD